MNKNQFDQNAFLQKCVIYVGGLHPLATKTHLHQLFITFGQIKQVAVPLEDDKTDDKNNTTNTNNLNTTDLSTQDNQSTDTQQQNQPKRNKGYALIEFEEAEDAEHAIANMNDSDFFGNVLRVSLAQSNQQKGKMKWDVEKDTGMKD